MLPAGLERPQHILLNVTCVYTAAFIFSPPHSETGGSGKSYSLLPCPARQPLRRELHERGWPVAVTSVPWPSWPRCHPWWKGQAGPGWPSGDGARAAPCCGVSPPPCLGATPRVPMSHPNPAGALGTTTTNPRPQTLLALPRGTNPGPDRAGSRQGRLYVSTGLPGCRKTRLDSFPVGAGWGGSRTRTRIRIGTGGGAWLGAGPGPVEGAWSPGRGHSGAWPVVAL